MQSILLGLAFKYKCSMDVTVHCNELWEAEKMGREVLEEAGLELVPGEW